MTVAGPEPVDEVQNALDREHYVIKQVQPVVEPVLATLGLDFESVIGDRRQLDLLGGQSSAAGFHPHAASARDPPIGSESRPLRPSCQRRTGCRLRVREDYKGISRRAAAAARLKELLMRGVLG